MSFHGAAERTRGKHEGAGSHLVTMREKSVQYRAEVESSSRELRLSIEPLDPTWHPGLFMSTHPKNILIFA